MFDELKKLNIDTYSDSELTALIRQIFPVFTLLLKASEKLIENNETNPCKNCYKYDTCKEPCELLENNLPGVIAGSYLFNKTYGNLMERLSDSENSEKDTAKPLKTIEIPDREAMFNLYDVCQHIFTDKQWNAICMRYKFGMQNKQIAQQTGQTQSSVSDMLKRAGIKMEKFHRKRSRKKT